MKRSAEKIVYIVDGSVYCDRFEVVSLAAVVVVNEVVEEIVEVEVVERPPVHKSDHAMDLPKMDSLHPYRII